MSVEVINYIRKSDLARATQDRLIQLLHERQPEIKGDPSSIKKIITTEIRKKSTIVLIAIPTNITQQNREKEVVGATRKIPIPCQAYTLVHTISGTPTVQEDNHKEGGYGVFGTPNYISIDSNPVLDVTTDICISFWFNPKASSGTGYIVFKSGAYEVTVESSNVLRFKIGTQADLNYTFTSHIDTWVHVICQYNSASGGKRIYINNSLAQSDALTGAIPTNTNILYIGGSGSNYVPTGTGLSQLHINSGNVDATWRTNISTNRRIDTSDGFNEITTIPFMGDWNPQPDAYVGLCQTD
jgi:hypothetical protein